MKLADFLSAPLPEWDFRHHDCCRWVARWIVARDHACPIESLGLRYSTERGALLTIKRGGGLTALWGRGMTAVGVPEAAEPQPGDVAVIHRPTSCGLDEAMAIRVGERWASLALRGLEIGPAEPLKVWRP
ncbi:MAG: hypothetical protein PGN16_04150 [Sphingomonas phyllosphaerae]|uniref:DUF6950 family protein n=1 Tax=Sphingomonas phyllosphaerae TaxID=257003 RepID=UPI002FF79759